LPEQKDTIAAILGASAALAGLLLVFVGFVYARGEDYSSRRGDAFKIVAKLGVAPFLLALACTWFSVRWFTGSEWAFWWSTHSFEWSLYLTAIYGAVTLLCYL
jgi:hypothetical protein